MSFRELVVRRMSNSAHLYFLALTATSLLVYTTILKSNSKSSRVLLGRDESDDVYEGEWNLRRGQQADFPGANPDNPNGPSWMIGMHRDGESTPGFWAKNNQVPQAISLTPSVSSACEIQCVVHVINSYSRKSSMGNN